jgi:hypothetical protein
MQRRERANNGLLLNQRQSVNGMAARNPQVMAAAMQNKLMAQEMNGQRPQTPGDNAPSPSKRPRLENGTSFDARSGPQQQQLIQNGQGFPPSHPLKLEQANGMAVNIPPSGHGGEGISSSCHSTTFF